MTQAEYLPFTPTSLGKAKNALISAQANYAEALNEHLDAKTALENDRADLLANGVEGRNADEREAKLRLALFDQYAHLAGCEAQLTEARRDLESARVEWDALRYRLRVFEALAKNPLEVAA